MPFFIWGFKGSPILGKMPFKSAILGLKIPRWIEAVSFKKEELFFPFYGNFLGSGNFLKIAFKMAPQMIWE